MKFQLFELKSNGSLILLKQSEDDKFIDKYRGRRYKNIIGKKISLWKIPYKVVFMRILIVNTFNKLINYIQLHIFKQINFNQISCKKFLYLNLIISPAAN